MSVFRLGWATDLHFDQHSTALRAAFVEQVLSASLDSLLITGDISNARRLIDDLNFLHTSTNIPLFFVCGNHDFYGSSITKVRNQLKDLNTGLFYLTQESHAVLGKHTALVGHDSWSDGRSGDYLKSFVKVQDISQIEEYQNLNKEECWNLVKGLADQATEHFKKVLPTLVSKYEKIVVAIHPPPFREACLYKGSIADDTWAPHFVAQGVGAFLETFAQHHPKNKFLVLCGHAHCGAALQKSTNLLVFTGRVRNTPPLLQKVIELKSEND